MLHRPWVLFLLAILMPADLARGAVETAGATADGRLTIRQVLSERGGNRLPNLLGHQVSVQGVATYEPHIVGQHAAVAVIQEEGAGLWLFTDHPDVLVGRFTRGDLVQATGRLVQYHGRFEVAVSEVRRLGEAAPPTPQAVTVSDLVAGSSHAAQLVRVKGQLERAVSPFDRRPRLTLRDGTGEIAVLLTDDIYATLSFAENLMVTNQVTLVGIAGVDSLTEPTAADHRLTLRDARDIFPPPIPYRLIAQISVAITVLIVVGALWQRHRAAERRARELAELSERLREAKETAEAALAKVRTLSGFLPICASCKRIRDDKGYWEQIESYIQTHTEAEFSHGICPECYARLYPDYPVS
jgi:hypothetical protein